MQVNFTTLKDILFVKFKQLEDTKTAVRDVIAFQKLYYPMLLQAEISKNINELEVSKNDMNYQMYCQAKTEDMAHMTAALLSQQKKEQDVDLAQHYRELERYELTSCEWQTKPQLKDARCDFVGDLVERYLEDISNRQLKSSWADARYCAISRKCIQLDGLEDLIDQTAQDLIELTKSAGQKEAELSVKQEKIKTIARVSASINQRLGFKKEAALPRSMSFKPKLEDFEDAEDKHHIENEQLAMRRTVQGHRGKQNTTL